ncbi:MAG: hypothetical protein IK078_11285, partial [Lachnospiraceae bacterium]|nr:hypothetical protein [Lachnospiraceae bacterium]
EELILYVQWKKQETQVTGNPETSADPGKNTGGGTSDQTKNEPTVKTKAANPLKIKGKTVSIKQKKIQKKKQQLDVSKLISGTKKGQGQLAFKIVSAKKGSKSYKKKFKIHSKTGKLTVKKGLKKGTYKIKVSVKAAGNDAYEASEWLSVTCKVKIR